MNGDNPIRLVRELKGAPLSIYLVLGFLHQRVTQEYLERATGYTDKPVSQGLAYLQEIGMADHTRAGWALCNGVRQLPLPLEEIQDQSTDSTDSTDGEEGPGDNADSEEITTGNHTESIPLSRNNSDSLLITTTNINSLINLDSISSSINGASRKNSDPSSGFGDDLDDYQEPLAAFGCNHDREGYNPEAIREALRMCQVAEPKLSALVLLTDICAVQIWALCDELKRLKGERYGPGLLIHALEHGQRASGRAWDAARQEWWEYCREVANERG